MAQKSVPGTTAAITFSIVIPNARVFPHRLVKELVAQSNDDEIIVVRNRPGSGRDRWLHLTSAADSPPDESEATIIESDTGAATARNAGWQTAAHPWVLFLDDDVLPLAGMLDALRVRLARRGPALFTLRVRSPARPWSDVVAATIALDRGEESRSTGGTPVALDRAWQYGTGAAVLAHRDILSATGGFKDALGAGRRHGGAEDLEFLWHASRHTAITYLSDIAVDHADVDSPGDIGRKFRHYGRAIAHLAGMAKGREGTATVKGYCVHLLRATFSRSRCVAPATAKNLWPRVEAIRAVLSTLWVYLVALARQTREGVLCPECAKQ